MTTATKIRRSVTLGDRELPLWGLVLVAGRAGSGKTTFVDYVEDAAKGEFDAVIRIQGKATEAAEVEALLTAASQTNALVIVDEVSHWDTKALVDTAYEFARACAPLILTSSDPRKFPPILRGRAAAMVALDCGYDTAWALIGQHGDVRISDHGYLLSVNGTISAGRIPV